MAVDEGELRERTKRLLTDVDPADQVAFRGAQFDRGLAWVHYPVGRGGLGLGRSAQAVVQDELRAAGVTYNDLTVNPIGIGMAAPTLLTYASNEVLDRHLRPTFTGEAVWCQLFSEPGHGSDLAGLSSRAARDGNRWVVSGQKVWTTLAHIAKYGLLVARTDPAVRKHEGLSCFVLDMSLPGVEVRPLFQMTGEAEFNEVFLTDVVVDDTDRLGEVGEGWKVAQTTLMNERVSIGGGGGQRGSGAIRHLLRVWGDRSPSFTDQEREVWRDRVADLWVLAEAQRLTNWRARAEAKSGNPGPGGSVAKLVYAEMNQDIFAVADDLLGAIGTLHEPGYPMARAEGVRNIGARETSWEFLRAQANSIEGGTSNILRNILGERVLGLPSDVRIDVDIPWQEISHSKS